jgi:superfamily II DNA or RNA helicase
MTTMHGSADWLYEKTEKSDDGYNILLGGDVTSSTSSSRNQYVNLQTTGKIFPFWVLHNFKRYKLPPIMRAEGEDPCAVETKVKLRLYQAFVGAFLGPATPYNSILLYHGLGSGKTAVTINLINLLYNYDHNYNFIVLIKAALRDDPWMSDLRKFLGRNEEGEIESPNEWNKQFETLHFVHYDSPKAGQEFLDTMKRIDPEKPILFVIDEAHNFIRNVYSNLKSSKGRRAQIIYEHILREKRENRKAKLVMISATPAVNYPFELSLLYNLLRPGTFPNSEAEFNRLFITDSNYPILNPLNRNLFIRRILGLTSYYIGAAADTARYAKQILKYINLPMSRYQYDVYRVFEKYEESVERKARRYGKTSQLYRTYTRQACNFVFPHINSTVNGESRPRPKRFRNSLQISEAIEKGKTVEISSEDEKEQIAAYFRAMAQYVEETEKYFRKIDLEDRRRGHTIQDDLKAFQNQLPGSFLDFYQSDRQRSELLTKLYESSPKMTNIVFLSYVCPGKVMIYTNYVMMEGIEIFRVYFRMIGFDDYTVAKPYMGFCEYHGRIDKEDRKQIKKFYNEADNIYGEKCKVIMISPSATEGIQLTEIRQEHINEPYWTEVRIEQVVGRGIRQCSHSRLKPEERIVDVYRYKVTKPESRDPDDSVRISTDQHIEDQAKAKSNLIESFLSAMKESAVDCELFKNHNFATQTYQCFKFPEASVMGKYIGPAFKEDIRDDIKFDSGLYAQNSRVERIKVIRIKAVYRINPDSEEYSNPDDYWYYSENGTVYDFETHYPVGQVKITNGLPDKLDKETFIISFLINIPTIQGTTANP